MMWRLAVGTTKTNSLVLLIYRLFKWHAGIFAFQVVCSHDGSSMCWQEYRQRNGGTLIIGLFKRYKKPVHDKTGLLQQYKFDHYTVLPLPKPLGVISIGMSNRHLLYIRILQWYKQLNYSCDIYVCLFWVSCFLCDPKKKKKKEKDQ